MKQNKTLLTYLGIALIFVAIAGISYAAANILLFGDQNSINSGAIEFIYKEPTSDVTINQKQAMTDADGQIQNNYFAFTVNAKATGKVNIGYYIYYIPDQNNTLSEDNIKLFLTTVDTESDLIEEETPVKAPVIINSFPTFDISTLTSDPTKDNYLIHSSHFSFNNNPSYQYHYYRLRVWSTKEIDDEGNLINADGTHSYVVDGGTFKMKINVYGHDGMPVPIS